MARSSGATTEAALLSVNARKFDGMILIRKDKLEGPICIGLKINQVHLGTGVEACSQNGPVPRPGGNSFCWKTSASSWMEGKARLNQRSKTRMGIEGLQVVLLFQICLETYQNTV